MYNSILQLAVSLTEKICERTEAGEIRDLDIMADEILSDCRKTSAEIIRVIIRYLNESIRNDKQTRKDMGLVIKEKDRPRQLLTHLGPILFERDYYYDKDSGTYTIPLDQILGIEKRERVGGSVRAALIAQATDSSYAKSSVIVTGGAVSRQTVHDQILKMDVPESRPYEEHKQISQLHVYADEDHAHMQKPGKEKGKKNKSVPLVTVTEGTAPLSGGRNRTIRPMHFSDENFDTKNLWKTVGGYIARAYDTEELEKIYVHGDGGGWIRNGLEEYPQSVHVMDGYHFFKGLKRICRILPERNIRIVITNALRKDDRRKADLFLQELLSEPLTEKDAVAQSGEAVHVDRDTLDNRAGSWKGEIENADITLGEHGTPVDSDKSKQVHAGEQNIIDNHSFLNNEGIFTHEITIDDGVSAPKCTQEAVGGHLGELASAKDEQFEVNLEFEKPCDDYSKQSYEQFRAEAKDAYPNVTINYPWDNEEV